MNSKCDLKYKGDLLLDLHLPECSEFDLFVYFHGGGLVAGSRKDADCFAKTLTDCGVAVATVEYTMYPAAKFPDFIVDCADAVKWLKDNISSYGKCKRIFLGGSSAGGYISMMLCFDERYLKNAGIDPSRISGYIHDAGQPTSHFNVLKEFGQDSRRVIVDETAPIYFVGMQESYPPMIFIVSDNDMFARYEQTMLMIKTLNHFGFSEGVYLELMHGKHCAYVRQIDEAGEGVFGKLVLSFLSKLA